MVPPVKTSHQTHRGNMRCQTGACGNLALVTWRLNSLRHALGYGIKPIVKNLIDSCGQFYVDYIAVIRRAYETPFVSQSGPVAALTIVPATRKSGALRRLCGLKDGKGGVTFIIHTSGCHLGGRGRTAIRGRDNCRKLIPCLSLSPHNILSGSTKPFFGIMIGHLPY